MAPIAPDQFGMSNDVAFHRFFQNCLGWMFQVRQQGILSNFRIIAGEWLRQEPGWICSTSPSSRLMRAISVSIFSRH